MTGRASNRRVRTGCLTCRGRRRKCDEQKPECANCKSKGLLCRYGGNLTFVMSSFQDEDGHTTAKPRRNRETTQLSNSHLTHAPNPLQGSTEFPQSLDKLFPASTPFRQPVTTRVDLSSPLPTRSDASPIPLQQHHRGTSQSPAFETQNLRRRLYELELLTFYRYNVAPVLDLGLGSLYFGVQLLVWSKSSERLHHAILALASSQRALTTAGTEQVDQATSIVSTHLARGDSDIAYRNLATPDTLLLWREVYLSSIDQWSTIRYHIQELTQASTGDLEEWLLLARLYCAVRLVEHSGNPMIGSIPSPPQKTADKNLQPFIYQLSESLWLLVKTLDLLPTDALFSNSTGFVAAHDWHTQWQHLQQWQSRRCAEMRQIFELADQELLNFEQQDSVEFPHIVFSNACAVVANVAHHLASLILLHHKPRLTKLSARSNSSVSPHWHSNRVISIVSAAAETDIWDPFITAALGYCSRRLSNDRQICSVINTMKRIQEISGLRLETAISQLEELSRNT